MGTLQKNLKQGDIVSIKWYDAYHVDNFEQEDMDIPGLGLPMNSIGHLIGCSDKKVVVALTRGPDDWTDVLIIPANSVSSVEVLRNAS